MAEQPERLDEEQVSEIEQRLRAHPELLARFQAGDSTALVELLEIGTETTAESTEVRLLA